MDFACGGRGTGRGSQFAFSATHYAHTPKYSKYVRPLDTREKTEKSERERGEYRNEVELIQLSLCLSLSKLL